MEYILLVVGAVFVNNFVLSRFLGICPFLGVSKRVPTALGMSGAVLFVMTAASAVTWAVQHLILEPLNIGYLQTIAFILVIVAIPQWQETGQEYLEHVFSTKERAEAVNRLLVTGLSLITLALALFLVGVGSPRTPTDAVTTLFFRLAALLAVVGLAYLTNLGAYGYLGNRIEEERADDAADAVETAESGRTQTGDDGRIHPSEQRRPGDTEAPR